MLILAEVRPFGLVNTMGHVVRIKVSQMSHYLMFSWMCICKDVRIDMDQYCDALLVYVLHNTRLQGCSSYG